MPPPVLPGILAPLSAVVVRTGTLLVSGGWTAITWQSVERNIGSLAGTPTFTAITIPAGGAGEYEVEFSATWPDGDLTGSANRACRLVRNATVVAVAVANPTGSSGNSQSTGFAARVYCAVGDTLQVEASSGASAAVALGGGGYSGAVQLPRLSLARVAA